MAKLMCIWHPIRYVYTIHCCNGHKKNKWVTIIFVLILKYTFCLVFRRIFLSVSVSPKWLFITKHSHQPHRQKRRLNEEMNKQQQQLQTKQRTRFMFVHTLFLSMFSLLQLYWTSANKLWNFETLMTLADTCPGGTDTETSMEFYRKYRKIFTS